MAVLLTACSGGSGGNLGAPPAGQQSTGRTVTDTLAGAPGDTLGGAPGDTLGGAPGDTLGGTPGDTLQGTPGDLSASLPGNARNLCAPDPNPGQTFCLAQQNLDVVPIPNAQSDPLTIKGYQPKDIAAIYHLPITASGQTVAIVDAYDNPVVEADLAVYRAVFGLSACTTENGCFRKVNQAGVAASYPASNTAWGGEIALDVEMVSAACPNCKILLVEANSASLDDLGASVDRAVAMGARFISNSYSALEFNGENVKGSHYNHPGVAITVASGDGGPGATYPAASAYVTAVGGTIVTGSNGNYSETQGWSGSGRGCSMYVARPSWQSGAGTGCKTRAVVDVAAIADPASGVAVYDSFVDSGQLGGWQVFGGTSVGAPIVAAAYALANDFGSANNASRLYSRASLLHDIPPASYDYATGLGSPNGIGAF